jgi:hypothetical protein
VKTSEAIAICEGWFDYIERQRLRSVEMQKLATMARNGQQEEAQKRLRQMDTASVTVYDGARLEPAVRALVKMARASIKASASDNGNGDRNED